MSDEEILDWAMWTMECESPLEISENCNPESRACGNAAKLVIEMLRQEWEEEQKED